MRRLLSFAMVLLWLPGAAVAQISTPASLFTASQRAEIVEIVRDALKSDPSILRDAAAALERDDAGRQADASSRAITSNHAAIFAGDDPVAGNPDGPVTLVEFFDVRCPYCRSMQPVIEQFLHEDTGVRLVLKDLPILGPASVLGAHALLAARAQGGYLKMQAALMRNGVTVDDATVQAAARQAGLDWPRLQTAMADPAIAARIDANLAMAGKLGIEGTPAMVIGDQLVSGALTLDQLRQAAALLRGGKG